MCMGSAGIIGRVTKAGLIVSGVCENFMLPRNYHAVESRVFVEPLGKCQLGVQSTLSSDLLAWYL